MGRVMQARNSRKYFSDVVIFFSIMLSAFLKNVEPLHPNLCTGGHNYHGKYEFICIQSMEKTVELLLKIAEKFTKVEKQA